MLNNFKMTSQRYLLLKFIENDLSHPTAEDIFVHLRTKLPHLSKKTVYNNLDFLRNEGIINEININGVKRFEMRRKPHCHLICRECNRVNDIEISEIIDLSEKVSRELEDFEVTSITTHFYGICKECKEKTL